MHNNRKRRIESNVTKKIKIRAGLTLSLISLLLILAFSGHAVAAGEMEASRDISETEVNPGDTFRVSVNISASVDVNAPALDEDLPAGWSISSVDAAGATFKASEQQWIWIGSFAAGESKLVVYDVTVPGDAAAGTYPIGGNVSAFGVDPIPVTGDSEVTIDGGDGEPGPIFAYRDISDQTVAPGDNFTVTVNISASEEVVAPALDEDLPDGWNLTQVDNAGATFKPSTLQWVWIGNFSAGESRQVVYDVEVPLNASEGSYLIGGNVSAFEVAPVPVEGEEEVTVSEFVPDGEGVLLYPDWNFISVPHILKNASVSYVLQDVAYDSLLYYNAESEIWETPSDLEPLKAYWVLANGTENQTIPFNRLERKPVAGPVLPPSVRVYEGWNAIGYTDSNDTLSAELVLKNIDEYYTYILGPWDPVSESYAYTGHNGESGIISGKHVGTDVFEMEPYEGYWVYVTENRTLAGFAS